MGKKHLMFDRISTSKILKIIPPEVVLSMGDMNLVRYGDLRKLIYYGGGDMRVADRVYMVSKSGLLIFHAAAHSIEKAANTNFKSVAEQIFEVSRRDIIKEEAKGKQYPKVAPLLNEKGGIDPDLYDRDDLPSTLLLEMSLGGDLNDCDISLPDFIQLSAAIEKKYEKTQHREAEKQ